MDEMICPYYGAKMENIPISEAHFFKGKEIELKYLIRTCTNCGAEFIDVNSLQEAWKEARKEL